MPLYARLWTDILGDPKLRRAADEGAKHLYLLPWFIAWAKRADAEGRIETSGKPSLPRELARDIPNVYPRSVEKALQELSAIGVLTQDPDGCYRFVAWEYRNAGKASDSKEAVAERVRLHRARKRGPQTGNASQSGDTDGNARNALHVTDVTSKRVESREEREESKRESKESKRSSSEKVSLPPAALDFGRVFYRAAPRDRQRDVKRQLVATLNGGAQLRRGVKVRAGSVERLEAKCREVIAEGVRDSDSAIVVLLTKLGDVGNAQDSPTEAAAAAVKSEERTDGDRLAHALAWLELQPELAKEIDELVEKGLLPGSMPAVISIYRNAAILKAWKDAGEPTVQPAGSP